MKKQKNNCLAITYFSSDFAHTCKYMISQICAHIVLLELETCINWNYELLSEKTGSASDNWKDWFQFKICVAQLSKKEQKYKSRIGKDILCTGFQCTLIEGHCMKAVKGEGRWYNFIGKNAAKPGKNNLSKAT